MGTALSPPELRIPPEAPGRPTRPSVPSWPLSGPATAGGGVGPASLLWPGERGSTPGAAENPLPGCRAAPPDQSLPEGERGHRGSDTPTPLGVPQGGWRSPVLASGVLEVLSPARDLDKGVRCKLRCDLWKRWGRTGYREWRERGVSDRETRTPASPQTVRGGCRKHRPCKSRSPLRFFEQRGLPSLAPRQELASSNRRIRDPFFRWSVGGRGSEAFSYPAWA